MLRIVSIIVALAALVAFPAVSSAQDNAGTDAYTEGVPDAGGGGTGSTGTDTGTSATGTDTGTATGSTASGIDPATGQPYSESSAGNAPDGTFAGQLPATGLDELVWMAFVGIALLASGMVLKRRLRDVA
jgi:LPXTG-motif cell wall-anchored protein